jgi:3-hydroxyisobutyrate dehydrogenase-like beta-hydroxyacid dehydrogenase
MAARKHRAELVSHAALIGTGTMGGAMARRLLASGMKVDVWSRHLSSTVPFTGSGATIHEDVVSW